MLRSALFGVLVLGLVGCSELPLPLTAADSASPPPSARFDVAGAPVVGRYIVRFRSADPDWRVGLQGTESLYGPIVIQREYTSAIRGAVLQMSDAAAGALRANPNVETVEPDLVVTATTVQQSPPSWGLDRIDQRSRPLSQSYTYGFDGRGVTVYVLDTGIDFGQADFTGRARAGVDVLTANGSAADCNGHGTHVAGTVGSTTYGVAKRASLVAVRVLDCAGRGYLSDVIAGMDWVLANAALPAVANMSLGGGFSSALNQAVENSIAAGITYVVAAGNSATDACATSPASAPSAITVGATDISDAFAYFSNFGTCVRINAPGVSITSLWLGSSTSVLSGTSMASPHVAGAVALYLQAVPTATPAQVRSALTSNATANVVSGIPGSTPNLLLYTGFLNVPAVARFSSSCALLACVFDGSSSTAFAGATYAWNFGDGATASGVTTRHAFAAGGTFAVTLTVTDANGPSAATRSVTVAGNRPPTALISSPASGATFTRAPNGTIAVSFAGTGTDPEDGALSSASLVWTSSRDGQIGTGLSFTKSDLSVGTHTITLTARDAQGATGSATMTVTIVAPAIPVASFTFSCTFLSCSFDAGTSTAAVGATYGWTLGDATTGAGVTASHTYAVAGIYSVRLTVTDATGSGTVVKSVSVVANRPPVALVSSPANGASFTRALSGTVSVVFTGTANDPESGPLNGASLVWTSSQDGQIGTGPTFSRSDLSVGTHIITLTARDAQGATGTAATTITIALSKGPPLLGNRPPSAVISSPANLANFTRTPNGTIAVSFAGTGTDPEDGALSGASLVWTSSRDGQIGTGTSFTKGDLSVGTHTITLTAKDAQGASGVATRTITIVTGNQPPVAAFTTVCGAAISGDPHVCALDASTSTDDAGLGSASFAWDFGDGRRLTTSALKFKTKWTAGAGTYVVTLVVTDAQGLSSSISKSVLVP